MFLSDVPAFSLSFSWPGYGKMYPIPGITTDIQPTSAPAQVICLAFLKGAAAELRATAGLRISLPQEQAVAPEKPVSEARAGMPRAPLSWLRLSAWDQACSPSHYREHQVC